MSCNAQAQVGGGVAALVSYYKLHLSADVEFGEFPEVDDGTHSLHTEGNQFSATCQIINLKTDPWKPVRGVACFHEG